MIIVNGFQPLTIITNGFQPLTIVTKRSILAVAAALDPPLFFTVPHCPMQTLCLVKHFLPSYGSKCSQTIDLEKPLSSDISGINQLIVLDF